MVNGLIVLAVSVIFWTVMLHILHLFVMKPLMLSKGCQKAFPSTAFYKNLKSKEQWYYTSYYLGIVHALFAFFGAVWCFFYADGEVGTTWNHCNYFRHHMFDVQKYLHVFSGGYMLMDTFFNFKA